MNRESTEKIEKLGKLSDWAEAAKLPVLKKLTERAMELVDFSKPIAVAFNAATIEIVETQREELRAECARLVSTKDNPWDWVMAVLMLALKDMGFKPDMIEIDLEELMEESSI